MIKDRLAYILSLLVLGLVAIDGLDLYRQWRSRPQPPVTEAPRDTLIDLTGKPLLGSDKEGVVLIEFSDFECPFCARHATSVSNELHARFISGGQISHAFVNNPLPIHPNARVLASAAICAFEQNEFWGMRDVIFASRPTTRDDVIQLAMELRLEGGRFEECLDRPTTRSALESDIEMAEQLGLTVTPAFALGTLRYDGKASIKTLIAGAQPIDVFEAAILDLVAGD